MLLSQRQRASYSSGAGAPLPPRRVVVARSSLGALVAAALVLSAAALALVVQTAGWRGAVLRGLELRAAPGAASLLATELAAAGLERQLAALRAQADARGEPALSVGGAAVQFALAYGGQLVAPGDQLAPRQAQAPPAVLIRPRTSDGARFACVLVDLDAPDPAAPAHAPFLHYVVGDLSRGDNAPPADPRAAPVVVPYAPVAPPKGEHRYVALLLRQGGGGGPATRLFARDEAESARLAAHRANFDLSAFARAHDLHLVATSSFYSSADQ